MALKKIKLKLLALKIGHGAEKHKKKRVKIKIKLKLLALKIGHGAEKKNKLKIKIRLKLCWR